MDCGAQALKVVNLVSYYWPILDEDCLERFLLDAKVRNSKLMIVSTTGRDSYRNTYVLNIFLKYLNNLGKPDWMDIPNDPIGGFEWGHSNDKGILLWSEPFFIKVPSGEEVCILLMDANSYDVHDSKLDTALTLSSLLSSVQICSPGLTFLMDQFKFIVNYGLLAMEVFKEKPFQTFFFMRQPQEIVDYQPGFENGEDFWKFYMRMLYFEGLKEEEEQFLQIFKDVQKYILAYPGCDIFHQKESFRPYMSGKGTNPDFKSNLKTLTEHIFNPQNIVIKEINGKQVTGMELLQYFKSYSRALHKPPASPMDLIKACEEARKLIADGDYLPNYWSLIEKTEAWNVVSVDKAEDLYRREMNKIYDSSLYYLNHEKLDQKHQQIYNLAMIKLGKFRVTDEIIKDELSKRLQKLHDNYKEDLEAFKADPVLPSPTCASADGKLIVPEIKKCQ